MTSLLLISLALALLAAAGVYVLRRLSKEHARPFDLGVVSTRWLAELRRDEPWTRT